MPKKKQYTFRAHVLLPAELAECLREMVRSGQVENISQAVRRCIALAKTYLGKEAGKRARNS